jgi:hypothetical protein
VIWRERDRVLREGVAIDGGVVVVVVGRKKERASAKDIITRRARQRASAFERRCPDLH